MPPIRPLRFLVLLAALVALASSTDGREYRRMPWHLADVWWTLEREAELKEFSIDVEFETDVGREVRLFIAPIGLVTLDETKAYAGFQNRSRIDEQGAEGMRVIFSRWGERRRDHIRPEPGGLWESGGYEGDFISVRKVYPWRPGRYAMSLIRLDGDDADPPGAWVRLRVCFTLDERCESAGALKFPGTALRLKRQFASFVEIFGPAIDPDTIPKGSVVIGNVRVNGEKARLASASAYYPKDVPHYATARSAGEDRVRIEFGIADDKSGLPRNQSGTLYRPLFGGPSAEPRQSR